MWLILFCLLAAAVYFKYFRIRKYWEDRGVPTTRPWPLLGDMAVTLFRKKALAHQYQHIYNLYPDSRYIGMFNMTRPSLMIRDPELIKEIMQKETDVFTQHQPFLPEDADPYWSKNLFAMRGGEKWQKMRATLSPAYTASKIRTMFELMKEVTKHFCEHFGGEKDVVTVEMKDIFGKMANDIIATTAFGVSCDSLKHPENEFFLMGKALTGITGLRIFAVSLWNFSKSLANLLKIPMFEPSIIQFFKNIIRETVKAREEQGVVRPDLVHQLMEAQKNPKEGQAQITEEDIVAQALVFFFAGFETVSTTLCHASYELALNRHVQEKLYDEIRTTFADSEITYEKIMGMKYLDMVVTETLRKWPPFVSTDRQCVRPYTIEPNRPEEKPLTLPSGSQCLVPIYAIQRDAKYYPDPEKFDPERFSEANKANLVPHTYLPFGLGPRFCIGTRFALIEIKLILSEMVRNFEVVPIAKTVVPIVISKKNFTPVSDDGFWLGLQSRTVYSYEYK